MTCSTFGKTLIASFEGLRLNAYMDQNHIWTIGYGHTRWVAAGDTCTKEQAQKWLGEDLEDTDSYISKLKLPIPLTQNQYDALVSLIYNIGIGNFLKSSVYASLMRSNVKVAADDFLKWDVAAGRINIGLEHRRNCERDLFLRTV